MGINASILQRFPTGGGGNGEKWENIAEKKFNGLVF